MSLIIGFFALLGLLWVALTVFFGFSDWAKGGSRD